MIRCFELVSIVKPQEGVRNLSWNTSANRLIPSSYRNALGQKCMTEIYGESNSVSNLGKGRYSAVPGTQDSFLH